MCHPVDLAGKPVSKSQDERRIPCSAVIEDYPSSPEKKLRIITTVDNKEKGLVLFFPML